MMARNVFGTLFLMAVATATGASAQSIDPQREYHACMAEARIDPKAAFDRAGLWLGLGGGDAARHCQGAALIGMGQYAEGARRIEALAQDVRAAPGFRAELFAQAAQGWILDGDPQQAEALLSAALKLAPDDLELRLDRAQARAQRGDFAGAIEDLSAVLAKDATKVDALVFRASAYRQIDKLDLASADLVTALALNPAHPEALLERGMLNRLAGNAAAARRDWLTVIERAPASQAAAVARENLERMDSGATGSPKRPTGK